ncbi:hypothetical protein D6783_04065 [Candidatus Woesearchaeota archaeon]|nr:MAG: hypothetical protein D6783_04065 [Candidatus Woesearchaeota archaeon]
MAGGAFSGEGFSGQGRGRSLSGQGNVDLLEISQNVNNVASRLRVMEDRYGNLRSKLELSDKGLLDFERETSAHVKALRAQLEALRKEVAEATGKIERMVKELENTVKASDFQVIEKYVDAWQPLEFVTRRELASLLEELGLDKGGLSKHL